jgi:pSer/pThr/pTyr-binding forkhead associated (FHA) protein
MAKLVLSFQGRQVEDFSLDKPRITIGRAQSNDICIENLAVSGRHAVIETVLKDSFLMDLESTNGTFLNGKSIRRQALKNGDIIAIGKHSLTYLGQSSENEDEGVEKTIAMRPIQSSAAEAIIMTGRLQVKTAGGNGRIMDLSKPVTKLGKAGLQVAAISRRQNDFFLEHIEGLNGRTPKLNGEEIGVRPCMLNSGDEIEIANIRLEFSLSPKA